jgi:hypothetical protein
MSKSVTKRKDLTIRKPKQLVKKLVMQPTASEKNRKDLKEWFQKSEYTDVKFWVSPNVLASPEECVAEVLSAVTRFEKDKKSGKALPVGDDIKY